MLNSPWPRRFARPSARTVELVACSREARQRFEHDYIACVLPHHDWRMTGAAQTLRIQRRPSLSGKARQLGIPRA